MHRLASPRSICALTIALSASHAAAHDPEARQVADQVAGPVAPAPEFPPELTPPPRVEVAQARRLSQAGRHVEAAALLEALARELGDPRLLYHAALARSRAGQHRLALAHLQQVNALPGASAGELAAHLVARINEETVQLVAVRIVVRELVGTTAQPVAVGPGSRVTIEVPGAAPLDVTSTLSLRIDPGPARVRIDIPGYVPLVSPQVAVPGPGERTWEVTLVRKTVTLTLRFDPPRALRRARLRLTANDRAGLAPIDRAIDGPQLAVPLTTGVWQLEASSPRRYASQSLLVGPESASFDVTLQPRSSAQGSRFQKSPKLAIGVGALLGVTFYAGIGVLVGGANVESKAREKDKKLFAEAGVEDGEAPDADALAAVEAEFPTARLHHDLRRASRFGVAGSTVMMAGLGSVLGMLPSLVESRRRAGYLVLAAGAAATAGGAVWTHFYLRRSDERLAPTDPAQRVNTSGFIGQRMGASMVLGLGVGLTLGSSLLLLTDHLRRRKTGSTSAAPYAGPGQAGLVIRGRF